MKKIAMLTMDVILLLVFVSTLNITLCSYWNYNIKVIDSSVNDTVSLGNWGEYNVVEYYQPTGQTFYNILGDDSFTIAMSNDGLLHSWGYNFDGRLGHGQPSAAVSSPKAIEALRDQKIKTYALGKNVVYLVLENGDLYTWGQSILGDGTPMISTYTPTLINDHLVTGIRYIDVRINNFTIIALSDEGEIYHIGYYNDYVTLDSYGEENFSFVFTKIPVPQNMVFVDIKLMENAIIAIDTHGNAYSWGQNSSGELGIGFESENVSSPTQVLIPTGETVKQIEVGFNFALVLTGNNNVYSWGINSYGQLGHGDLLNRFIPTKIEDLPNIGIREIKANYSQAAILFENGDAYMWGHNNYKNLGLGDNGSLSMIDTPQISSIFSNVDEISLGKNHGFVRLMNGSVYAFGSNIEGELGTGSKNSNLVEPYYFQIRELEYELIYTDTFVVGLQTYFHKPLDFQYFTHKKWYYEQEMANPVNTTDRMPNYNIELYGYWHFIYFN